MRLRRAARSDGSIPAPQPKEDTVSVHQDKANYTEVEFVDVQGNSGARWCDQRLPHSARITAVASYNDVRKGIPWSRYEVLKEDVLVFTLDEKFREGEALCVPATTSLPPGARLMAVYSEDEDAVYYLNIANHYPGSEAATIRVAMALGTRGVLV